MSGIAALEEARKRSRVRLAEGSSSPESDHRVVAVVLADGSLREVGADWADQGRGSRDWASGSVAGNDWVLWWERRSFD